MYFRNNMSAALSVAVAVLLLMVASGPALAQSSGTHASSRATPQGAPRGIPPSPPAPHEHFDSRFSHNQYYYDRGYLVRRPPPGGVGELHGRDGNRYWYHGGNWYRRDGRTWIVAVAPFGLFVPFLPPYFTTIWWSGVPYYYANDTYYIWSEDRKEYEVVAPPDGIDSAGTPQAPPSNKLFVYPKNGQSAEQQSRDRYECHRWAVEQSGFDPTVAGGGVPREQAIAKRNDYFRAEVSCLEGRGYTVK